MSPAFEWVPFFVPVGLALACVIPLIFMKD